MSLYKDEVIMDKLRKAQKILEEAYIIACEKEIPAMEARYLGLHAQTISLTASYTPSDFVRSCYSRTSSNFCDECNYIYRLMYRELRKAINELTDKNSIKLYNWLFPEQKCINDGYYTRERLYNSDFTRENYTPKMPALNDWRKSGWKNELERMLENKSNYLTNQEISIIESWKNKREDELFTTYSSEEPDVLKNMIKQMDYFN
jgi:hypothetical protein